MSKEDSKWMLEGCTGYTLMHNGWSRGKETMRNRLYFQVQRDSTVMEQEAKEAAAFIVNAVNSHDDMADAIKRLLGCMSLAGWEDDNTAIFAREVLKKAGAK